jgi:hypothetical protein
MQVSEKYRAKNVGVDILSESSTDTSCFGIIPDDLLSFLPSFLPSFLNWVINCGAILSLFLPRNTNAGVKAP